MNFFNRLKSNIAKARRDHQEILTENFCRLSNDRIMSQLKRECPQDHLIMVERFFGLGNVSFMTSFCQCKNDFLSRMSPTDPFLVEPGTGRIIFNPANFHSGLQMVDTAFDHKVIEYNNGNKEVPYDIVTHWEYVPYPERWQQQ